MRWKILMLAIICAATYAAPARGAWGTVVRTFIVRGTFATGIAVMPDGYLFVSDISRWYCYTTTGTFVKSMAGRPFTDGSGRSHLPGYFVVTRGSSGVWQYRYDGGGDVGPGALLPISATGRGLSWDGTYYYVTTGSYGTPIGIYSTSGSIVGTVTGTWTVSLYGHATRPPGNGYLNCVTRSPSRLNEIAISNGLAARSVPTQTSPAGVDIDDNGYIYVVRSSSVSFVYVFDSGYGPNAVDPASLGRVKALFR